MEDIRNNKSNNENMHDQKQDIDGKEKLKSANLK